MREYFAGLWVGAGLSNESFVGITQDLAQMAGEGDVAALEALKLISVGESVPHTLLNMGLLSHAALEQCGIPVQQQQQQQQQEVGVVGGGHFPPLLHQQQQLQQQGEQQQQQQQQVRPEFKELIGKGLWDDVDGM